MVEVFVFVEPFISDISVAILDQSVINWIQILHSTLYSHKLVSRFKDRVIATSNTQWVPSLLDLRVRILRDSQICIQSLQKQQAQLLSSINELQQENDLLVSIKVRVDVTISRTSLTLQSNVSIS